ncbi:MAG: antibiotic biosynthesis monooxygenase [Gammaproteobacteria bacterium]
MRESGVVASPHVVAGAQRSPAHWCLARSLPVPVVFLLYEVYKDEAAYRLHRQTEYYARFRREAPAVLETEDGELYHLPPRAAAPMAGGGILKQERRNKRRETCPMSS